MKRSEKKMSEIPYWSIERTRQLIAIVRNNLGLYAKGSRMFKDKQAKDLAWQSVGARLGPPCTGDMAAKRFKHLRDTFQKERRKVAAHIPASGAGADNITYESTWEFYNDLLFLSEHVSSRTTISNYSGKSDYESSCSSIGETQILTEETNVPKDVPKRKRSESLIRDMFQEELSKRSNTESIIIDIPSISAQYVSSGDNDSLLSDMDESSITFDVTSDVPSTESTTEAKTSAQMSTSQCKTSLSGKSPTIRGKAINSILQHKVPEPDTRRKGNDQQIIRSCIEQLSKSAAEVAAKISCPTEAANNEEMLMLQYIMKTVPEDKKLLCISDICRVAEIYRKGGCPSIIDKKD